MRILKTALLVFVAAAVPLAAADQASSLDQVVDRVSSRETALVSSLRQYSPLVETYIQNLRPDDQLGSVPAGDNYFLGRADLSTLVLFSGPYPGGKKTIFFFFLDSGGVSGGPAFWLPAFFYSKEANVNYGRVGRRKLRAKTRLWGYNLGRSGQEQELSKVL